MPKHVAWRLKTCCVLRVCVPPEDLRISSGNTQHVYYLLLRLLVFIIGLLIVPSAHAHSELVLALPAPGERLEVPPAEIRLTFSEVVGEETAVLLFGEGFQQIGGLVTEVEPRNPRQVFVPLPEGLEAGVYTVQWTAVSADGHQIEGSYSFQIMPQSTSPLVVGLGILLLLLLGLIFGRMRARTRGYNS